MAGKIQKAAQNNAVQNNNGTKTLQEYLRMYKGAFEKALPKMITAERFTRMAMTALTTNADLCNCTPQSFIGACLKAAQLGLEPNTPLGQAYLIPYKNNKKGVTECQFQVGYLGMKALAERSGQTKRISAHVVYENDEFDYEYGLEPMLKHKPAKTNRGKAGYVYAVYNLVNGGYAFEVMSIEDIRNHALKYSKQKDRITG
ncbi:MAG: recombinase RecT, partial [Candidatus Ornithomonoglobus sp.]